MAVRIVNLTRERFRRALVKACGGCAVQYKGWPCGTCFYSALRPISQKYWHAVLIYRGDCEDAKQYDGSYLMPTIADKYVEITKQEVRERIHRLLVRINKINAKSSSQSAAKAV